MFAAPLYLGIDLGGTKIEIIALDSNGQTLHRERVPTPKNNYPQVLATIAALVCQTEKKLGQQGHVGIGTPGTLSRMTGRIKNSNSTHLNGQSLLQDLQQSLQRPVRIANDADCFALSEAVDGAAAGAMVTFGVIIGTGVGGGVIVNGQALHGPNGITGEWGHNPLPLPAGHDLPLPSCYCGRQGCVETYLSGPGLARDHLQIHGQTLDTRTLVANALDGDAACQATLGRYCDRMARALATVINILDPDVIVLGGGLSNIDVIYSQVPERWHRYVFSDRVDTRLVQNKHGDASGVRGAAWLWKTACSVEQAVTNG